MKTWSFQIRIGLAGIIVALILPTVGYAQHPLDEWMRRSVPSPNGPLQSVAFGKGVFVAVGDNSLVARSSDGSAWTTSSAGAYGNLKRVRFLNGQFLAVGTSDKLIYSTDGASWSENVLPQAGFWDVAWGNGVYLIAGSSTYISSNGVDWESTHPIVVLGANLSYETALGTVVFGDGGFMGLPIGLDPFNLQKPSLFSSDGVNWVRGGPAPAGSGGSSELLFADGLWLAMSDDDPSYPGVLVSTNSGGNWSRRFEPPGLREGGALAVGQGTFLYVQNSFGVHPFTSTNSISWEPHDTEPGLARARSATFGHGTFVVVGVDGGGASYILQSGNLGGEPIIFQQPQDRGAVANNPATFSVQAVGAPPLAYQWYKNATTIPDATNTSHMIASVQTGDSGGYHVVITNSFGSVTSRVAQLTVAFLDIRSYTGVTVLGVPGRTYRIDATPASGTPDWQTVTNLVLPQSPYIWIDYDSPTLPSRLYRAAETP